MKFPAASNSRIAGGGTQQSACGGSSAAYLSLLSRLLGRFVTQTWSCESTKIPETCPSIHLFGNGFGQYGSTSNLGTPPGAAANAAASASKAIPARIFGFIRYLLGSCKYTPVRGWGKQSCLRAGFQPAWRRGRLGRWKPARLPACRQDCPPHVGRMKFVAESCIVA